MNLGEKIYTLRISKHMSQGDLANALEVSRQSISKWETNSSVPELDKLIKLSEVFGISLDELILNKQTATASPTQMILQQVPAPGSSQKTAGIVLLCFAALIWLSVTLLGDILSGLVFASPFLICGLICLFCRRNAGLWCAWTIYCLVDLYLRFATGVNWRLTFRAFQYSIGLTAHVIVAWAQVIGFSILSVITIRRFREEPVMTLKKNTAVSCITWALWGLSHLTFLITDITPDANVVRSRFLHFLLSAFDSIRSILFVTAIVFSIRSIKQFIKQRS